MMLNDTNNVFIIGLTGGSGSGKSSVAKILQSRGAYVIDCDVISHNIYKYGKPAYFEIIQKMGSFFLTDNLEIDRKALAKLVFSDKAKLKLLTDITHFYIKSEISNEIKLIQGINDAYKYIVLDAPLLIEANAHLICNKVWVCYAKKEVRIRRIQLRDGLTYAEALNRINSQMPYNKLKNYADVFIDTTNGLEGVEVIWDQKHQE